MNKKALGAVLFLLVLFILTYFGLQYLDKNNSTQNTSNIEPSDQVDLLDNYDTSGSGLDYGQTDLNSQSLRKNIPK